MCSPRGAGVNAIGTARSSTRAATMAFGEDRPETDPSLSSESDIWPGRPSGARPLLLRPESPDAWPASNDVRLMISEVGRSQAEAVPDGYGASEDIVSSGALLRS